MDDAPDSPTLRFPRAVDLVLLVVLAVAAFLPRLEAVRNYTDPALYSEEELYDRYAVPWAQGQGAEPREKFFPWHPLGSYTHRPPAYSLFVGIIYRLAGIQNFQAVKLVQVVLDTSSVLLVYLAGILLFGGIAGRAVGLLAGLAMARYDFLLQFVARLLTEPLYLWFGLVFLVLALAATKRRQPWLTFAAAYALGWANLTRPFLLPVLAGYLLWLAIAPRLPRKKVHLALAALGMVLAIAPVTWRNYQFHHELILISTNSGFTLWRSIAELSTLQHREELGTEDDVGALELGELAEQGEYRRRAMAYMRNHPEELGAIFGRKLQILIDAKRGNKISHVLMETPDDAWLYPVALIGALVSLLVLPKVAWHGRLLVFGMLASQYLVSFLANAEIRYRVPMVPLLALLTAWAAWALVGRHAIGLVGMVRTLGRDRSQTLADPQTK